MLRKATCVGLLLALSAVALAQTSKLKEIPPAEAATHLERRVEPVFPALAKAAGMGGTVVLSITIAPTGKVEMVRVVSGHPLFVQSSIDAVKQWKYKPFVENDQAVTVVTRVDVEFPAGLPEKVRETRTDSILKHQECRKLMAEGNYKKAEATCKRAVELARQLPPDIVLERSMAITSLAHCIFRQNRVEEAIPLYEEALALNKGYLKANDADLASSYANLARGYVVVGKLAEADELYATSITTFEAAIQDLPDMQRLYAPRFKRTLIEYAQLKEALGQNEAAAELKRKANEL